MFVCLFFHYIYHKAEWFEVSTFSNRAVLWLHVHGVCSGARCPISIFVSVSLMCPFDRICCTASFTAVRWPGLPLSVGRSQKKAKDLRLIWNIYLMPFVVAWIWSFCKWAKIVMRFGSYGFVSWCDLNVVAAKPKLHTFFRKRQRDKLLHTVV